MNRLWLVAALALPWAAGAWADEWGEVAVVSATLGVQDNRMCLGEGSRGAIGCPSYAPYVSAPSGFVGIGTNAPFSELYVSGTIVSNRLMAEEGVYTANFIAAVPGGANGQRSVYSLWGTFGSSIDYNPRRVADIVGGYDGGTWNSEYLSFSVGGSNDYYRLTTERMRITGLGNVGISTTAPSATLHVGGMIRIAQGTETCDSNRAGAIRFNGSNFQVCYGTGDWTNLSNASGTVALAINDLTDAAADAANGNLWLGTNNAILNNNQDNTAVGHGALDALNDSAGVGEGDYNSAYGARALTNNTSGHQNTAIGVQSLFSNTTGYGNIALGMNALFNNIAGYGNIGLGNSALVYQTDGTYNLAIGQSAAAGTGSMTVTGTTAVGHYAGTSLATDGNYNTFLGYYSGGTTTSGGYNTFLGVNAAQHNTTGSQNIALGQGADLFSTTGSHQLSIGNAIWGNIGSRNGNANRIGININSPTTALDVSGTVSATLLQLADNPASTCGPGTYGTIKIVNGRQYTCRP